MITVVPAAGHSVRFDDGDPVPKQFRYWDGVPMWLHAVGEARGWDRNRVVLVVRPEHARDHWPRTAGSDLTVRAESRGQADSVLRGLWETGPDDDDVLVVNCDSGWPRGFLTSLVANGRWLGGPVAAVIRVGPEDGTRWSYVDSISDFTLARERDPISEYALAGAYYFPSKRALVSALLRLPDQKGEPYLSGVYELLPGPKLAMHVDRTRWRDWGTAESWRADLARQTPR